MLLSNSSLKQRDISLNKTKSKHLKADNRLESKKNISTLQLFRTSLIYQTREFFNNSTLHGVRYIAETGRPFGERLVVLITFYCVTLKKTIAENNRMTVINFLTYL